MTHHGSESNGAMDSQSVGWYRHNFGFNLVSGRTGTSLSHEMPWYVSLLILVNSMVLHCSNSRANHIDCGVVAIMVLLSALAMTAAVFVTLHCLLLQGTIDRPRGAPKADRKGKVCGK